jgi:G3E family GTPase
MRKPIPVLVLAGFLGSGKTTMLNHLLRRGGMRVGVIVNDFGSVGVDAMLIGGQASGVVPVGNGCLCCVTDDRGIAPMLDQLARPGAGIDVIVIEASGIAEPGALVQLVLEARHPATVFGGLVEVVDAAEFEDTRRRHRELDRHVALADLVVLNKADRVDCAALGRVSDLCRQVNPRAPVIEAAHGAVDPRILFDLTVLPGRQLLLGEAEQEDHADHVHASYAAVSYVTDRPVDPTRLVAFLDQRSPGIYRIKGFVHFGIPGHRQRFGLHAVGRYLRFDRSAWPRGAVRRTGLDLIGTGIDTPAVREALRSCERTEPADPDSMPAVLRYLLPATSARLTPPAPVSRQESLGSPPR